MPARPKLKTTAKKAAAKTKGTLAKIPGPSSNPATNLLIMDVAMRGASLLVGRAMERAILRTRYRDGKAANIVAGRSFVQSMAANGAARMGTKSVPGFLLVAGGLLAKAVFDRSFSKREAVAKGEQQFAEQAAEGAKE
jgi:hypothetical protein